MVLHRNGEMVIPVWHAHNLRCRGSIPNERSTHVLYNDLTVGVLISARVLVSPLDGQDGPAIVVKACRVVTTPVVVLGVEQSVTVTAGG